MINVLLFADDLVFMSERFERSRNMLRCFDSKGLKIKHEKIKVVVTGGIANDVLSKSNVHQCVIFCLGVNANSILCVQCGKWIHSRCDRVKRVPKILIKILLPGNMKEILDIQWSNNKGYVVM